jgi:5-methylcytosine-specific restriction endonuclease McrA
MIKQDINGKRFGKLIVLNGDLPHKKALVRCDCGKEFLAMRTMLFTGKTNKCSSFICSGRTKDLSGQRFGNLLVIKLIGKIKDKWSWECICDCGKICTIPTTMLLKGRLTHCGCLKSKNISIGKMGLDETTIINTIISHYKANAKRRNIKFNLSYSNVLDLINKECYYCGVVASNTLKIKRLYEDLLFHYNGIDRMDSNKDYQFDNCITACKFCNSAKGNLSDKEFIELSKRISENFGKNTISTDPITKDKLKFLNKRYIISKYRAKTANLSFLLSKEEFGRMMKSKCHYCGFDNSNVVYNKNKSEKFLCNGIDRIDSNIGYISTNCVPCCKICNRAKLTTYYKDFVLKMNNIWKRFSNEKI